MGGNHSKKDTNVKYTKKIITETDIENFQKTLNNVVLSSSIKNATKCSGSLTQKQIFDMSDAEIEGDVSLDIIQQQTMALDYKCINLADIKNTVLNDMFNSCMEKLKSSYTQEVVDNINNSTKSKIDSGAMSMNISVTNSNKDVDINLTDEHKKTISISKVVENVIKTSINLENMQNCVSDNLQEQKAYMKNVKIGGNLILAIKQIQASNIISRCVIGSNFANQLTNKLVDKLDIDVIDESEINKKTDIIDVVDESSSFKNIMDSIGSIFGSIFDQDPVTKMLSLLCLILILSTIAYTIYKTYLK